MQQLRAQGGCDRACLVLVAQLEVERVHRRERNSVADFLRAPVVVRIRADRRVPQDSLYGSLALGGARAHVLRARRVRGHFAAFRDRQLQLIQQAVEIGRNEIGRVNRAERLAVREPARAEVPAAFRRSSQIAIDVGGRALRLARRRYVLAIRFLARSVAIVPVAIEQSAVAQSHQATMCRAGRERSLALHPERDTRGATAAGISCRSHRRRAARRARPSPRRTAAANG